MQRPIIAITMGDPAGVGPETIAGLWNVPDFHQRCRAVVIGDPLVMRRAVAARLCLADVCEVHSPEELASSPMQIPCLAAGSADAHLVPPAAIDPRGGQAAYDALVLAAELALAQRVDAITTCPLNKAALAAAGHNYPGHTELLADLCGVREVAMMLYLPPHVANVSAPNPGLAANNLATGLQSRQRVGLGVVHATLHMALRDVFSQLSVAGICAKIQLADRVMRTLLRAERCREDQSGSDPPSESGSGSRPENSVPPNSDSPNFDPPALPRIAVCALNPHGGEGGLFGDEEQRIIEPAVHRCQSDGFCVDGPFPADTLMPQALGGAWDAVVAMYHDQGHIPLKLVGMHEAVNVTLGLPIVRTSVAHGTAFDVAWQGRAECSGLLAAIELAAKLVQQKADLVHSDKLVV